MNKQTICNWMIKYTVPDATIMWVIYGGISVPILSIVIVEQQLNEVRVETVKYLIEIGSKQAWLRIRGIDDSACINSLYALEGAIQGI